MSERAKVHASDKETEKTRPEDLDKLESGPAEDRGCTDILCCLIFIAAQVGWAYLLYRGITEGEPGKLVAVYDQNSEMCGYGNQEKYPYLYFTVPQKDYLSTKGRCVDQCITATTVDNSWKCSSACTKSCTGGNDITSQASLLAYQIQTSVQNDFCKTSSKLLMGLVCFPDIPGADLSSFSTVIDVGSVQKWFDDVQKAKYIFAIAAGACFVLGIIYMIFTRIFAGVIVWIFIIAYFVGIIALAVFVYLKSTDEQAVLDKNKDATTGKVPETYTDSTGTTYTSQNVQTYLYSSYSIFGIAGVSFIGLLCMWKNIRLAIAVIKTATSFVIQTPLTMLVPPMFAVFAAVWWGAWIIGFVYLYSIGTYAKKANSIMGEVTHDEQTFYSIWVYIFFGLWNNAFILAVNTFVLASTACIWYFGQGTDSVHKPISRSIYRAFRYHLGSLAFGAFLLAVVQLIRLILEYITYQAKQSGADKNKCLKYLLTCLRCYMACFERFIEFLNKNAYIQIALSGRNFCSAAKEAVRVIWANPGRVALINGLGGAFVGIGKIFLVIATVWISYYLMTNVSPFNSDIASPFLPLVIIFFIAYAIAQIFMMIYGMAIDAILMCFLYDEEMNKGKGAPKHCPDLLREFFEENEPKK